MKIDLKEVDDEQEYKEVYFDLLPIFLINYF